MNRVRYAENSDIHDECKFFIYYKDLALRKGYEQLHLLHIIEEALEKYKLE